MRAGGCLRVDLSSIRRVLSVECLRRRRWSRVRLSRSRSDSRTWSRWYHGDSGVAGEWRVSVTDRRHSGSHSNHGRYARIDTGRCCSHTHGVVDIVGSSTYFNFGLQSIQSLIESSTGNGFCRRRSRQNRRRRRRDRRHFRNRGHSR